MSYCKNVDILLEQLEKIKKAWNKCNALMSIDFLLDKVQDGKSILT